VDDDTGDNDARVELVPLNSGVHRAVPPSRGRIAMTAWMWCPLLVPVEPAFSDAAELFKVLGHESRLRLLHLLAVSPRTVGALAEATGLSQPLVSQHLRTLRQTGLAEAHRHGREVTYRVSDRHVAHVIEDALAHVREPRPPTGGAAP
jgi:DNA-binding transcriptional ArsR family regulator